MGRVVIDVMPKPEILDPQGKAIGSALAKLGHLELTNVRQGKRFEIEVDGEVTDEVLAKVRDLAGSVFANDVVENVIRVEAL